MQNISVCISLFKLSHGPPLLHCLLRHYVSTITGNRHSQNALSSPLRVYVCILNTVKRWDSHALTQDSTLWIGFLKSGSYWQKTLLFNCPLTVWQWHFPLGERQTGYLHRMKTNWVVWVINVLSYGEGWNSLQLWLLTQGTKPNPNCPKQTIFLHLSN